MFSDPANPNLSAKLGTLPLMNRYASSTTRVLWMAPLHVCSVLL